MKSKIILTIVLFALAVPAYSANEINVFHTSGQTVFTVIREIDGDVWYVAGQVFEAWGTDGRTAPAYDIALTDKSGGLFVGDMDGNISAGYYYMVSHQQAAGAPADTDPAIWKEYGYWDGSNWKTTNDDIDAVQADLDIITGTSGVLIDTDAVDADALKDDAVDEIHDEVIEGTVTFRQAIRLFLSVMTGKSSGGGTATITFRDIGDTKNRLQVTVDSSGNRTAVGTRDGE